MLTIVLFGDSWVNKVSANFYNWTLKTENKTQVQLWRFGINGLKLKIFKNLNKKSSFAVGTEWVKN